ncbi:hypothetical protein HDV62DRAFT_133461 [Trichoderma sp. SZMC 28011]
MPLVKLLVGYNYSRALSQSRRLRYHRAFLCRLSIFLILILLQYILRRVVLVNQMIALPHRITAVLALGLKAPRPARLQLVEEGLLVGFGAVAALPDLACFVNGQKRRRYQQYRDDEDGADNDAGRQEGVILQHIAAGGICAAEAGGVQSM